MSIWDAVWGGLAAIMQPSAFMYMMLGIVISSTLVALPGIGSKTAIALLLPVAFTLEKFEAICLIVSVWAVSNTANSITSILFAVPGGSGSQATILDGYPMARNGEAARALAAAFTSSALGGVFGAIVLALSLPILKPLVILLGPSEFFVLILFGIAMVSTLSGKNKAKGLVIGLLGLLVSAVGIHLVSGVPRFTFGSLVLMEGLSLIPVTIGLFAVPELLSLVASGTAISKMELNDLDSGRRQGIRDAFSNWWLIIRSSLVGVWVGMIPGLGSSVADWFAYGHARATEKNAEETFGKGDVRGVIAVDAATNAKEGGSLIPTLAFGIPGSSTLALVFGGLLIVGVKPGKEILTTNLDVTFSFIWLLIIASVITSILCIIFIKPLAKATQIRPSLLVPVICALSVVGAFASSNNFGDVVIMALCGLAGYWLRLHGWPRPPLLLGLVLGPEAERHLWTSYQLYEWEFIFRPITGSLLILLFLIMAWPFLKKVFGTNKKGDTV
ncbi:tripartite tricarboxylate transporter permease [Litorivicinus sp.]|jgi:putative tricarboxylic transport membrane protein|nr:tripartite tricarboxylate transporter permease [Litorivicinus sp.]MDB9862688.1 tripartite tricarboxylate transporter permease [Litorivicinus sp.]MDC1207925.1 tripartite tricarboxylate transporter permease [Litorivicinus sp.]MDC1240591.1 tripartite tricarboxylate transporter permease [Litorivicinus sp.]MDC1466354.1 tripartite tricarboxylate transporter permease [Litorivicinus sp.]